MSTKFRDVTVNRVQRSFHPDKKLDVYLCPSCGSILESVKFTDTSEFFVGCVNDNCLFLKKHNRRLLVHLY